MAEDHRIRDLPLFRRPATDPATVDPGAEAAGARIIDPWYDHGTSGPERAPGVPGTVPQVSGGPPHRPTWSAALPGLAGPDLGRGETGSPRPGNLQPRYPQAELRQPAGQTTPPAASGHWVSSPTAPGPWASTPALPPPPPPPPPPPLAPTPLPPASPPVSTMAPPPAPVRAAGASTYAPTPVDWALVRTFRQLASQRLAEQLSSRGGIDEDDRRELGRAIVGDLLLEHARADAEAGRPLLDATTETALAGAVFDSLFGLGRLQPLVDLPDVENIEITGHDNVLLIYADGHKETAPPVADSDEELVEFLAFLAARRGGAGERSFSTASPALHLNLGGRARLMALMEVSHRPVVRIRKHLIPEVTMPMLRRLGTVDLVLEQFLAAAVRARKSIVVSGDQGSGKTTFVRALAGAIDPWEALATLETEYELFIHELPDRKRPAIALEARPGSGELRPDGRRAGAITLEEMFEWVLRANLDRVIVGEVRGPEAMAMFKAMQSGAGSLCTTHATSARDTIERLVTCVVSANGNEAYASRLVAQHIDVIVHLSAVPDPRTGRRRRFVDEVIEVTTGEGYRPAVNDLFRPGPDGRALPHTPPTFLDRLVAHGFDAHLLDDPGGAWGPLDAVDVDITRLESRR